jgi:glucosamine--fructose-6-phosphate aminotransferase (isomerizing)
MCGIIAYTGDEDAAPILVEALRRLEYRGYDSAGMITIDRSGEFELKKQVGRVQDIHNQLNLLDLEGSIGIAHTRWATHGGVTQANAHPHVSNNSKIAVIHNGIVENYKELKALLVSKGFHFESQTDTEVIPNLIEYWMDSKGLSFLDSTIRTLQSLEGNFAVVIIDRTSRTIIGAKNGSPLVLGVGDRKKNEFFLASDIPAFLDRTKDVVYLYDGDMVILQSENSSSKAKRSYKILDFRAKVKKPIIRPIQSVSWSLSHAAKGEFDHFMLKEIGEQVETIQKAAAQDRELVQSITDSIRNAKGVFLVASGSSYHACLSASYLFAKLASFHINTVIASEFSQYESFLKPETLVIAVSQSGETIDVLDAVKVAKEKGCQIVSIVNVMGSSLTQISHKTLLLNSGPEISVLSTKTYTAQLALLSLLAYSLTGKYEEGLSKLKFLWNIVYNLTAATTRNKIKDLSARLASHEHIFILGRGSLYATALEAALKIKEVSYIHAEAFAGGELKHGSIAMIKKGTPCIIFISKDTERTILSNAMEVKSRGGYIIGIGPEPVESFDFFIKVPESNSLNPICQIIPIQILAYQLAVMLGHDPDKPRNLAKSVTVR